MPVNMADRRFSTPMMQQYMQIKQAYADCLLLFRLGDFYELFLEDAQLGAKILGITLTARPRGKDGDIPMAGVPYHSADAYIAKLVRAGHKVAICEQISEPDNSGIVERQVVRIITPGTITDEANLDHKQHNYLLSLAVSDTQVGLTFAELSTGELLVCQFDRNDLQTRLLNELARFQPAEIIHDIDLEESITSLLDSSRGKRYGLDKWSDYLVKPLKYIRSQLQDKSITNFKLKTDQPLTQSLAACLHYLNHTQQQLVSHLRTIRVFQETDSLIMDPTTLANLEIFETSRDRQLQGSLISVLDQTQTAMGGRLMRHWLKHPLHHRQRILARQKSITWLLKRDTLSDQLSEHLNQISDLERLVSRINLGLANPKDLVRLQTSIEHILEIKQLLKSTSSPLLQKQIQTIQPRISRLANTIRQSLEESVPVDPKKGNFIRAGYNSELDQLRQVVKASKNWIAQAQETQRQRTGINSLKIKFNKVFGYYIEVSKANLSQVPKDYDRKQTLVNSERFITPDLKHHEEIVLSHEAKAQELEYHLFQDLTQQIMTLTPQLQQAARAVATLDCLLNLANIAQKYSYCKPTITTKPVILLKDSRHPVVEQLLADKQFVPNDVQLDVHNQLLIITGPNMAGKSVYMRQVALITLMAHIGSYVPARSAHVCLVDRIFVRSGAGDAITQGLSTFMVEMVETAQILHRATSGSLVIMDEIGRGTTTFDGISIAWAVAEYLVTKIGAKTLFATHYHELQALEEEYPDQIKNYFAAVEQHQDEPVFIHRILPGKATASYGIGVARLAGVPETVAIQAQRILNTLEHTDNLTAPSLNTGDQQLDLLESQLSSHPVINQLQAINISTLTPLEALNILARLKEQVEAD